MNNYNISNQSRKVLSQEETKKYQKELRFFATSLVRATDLESVFSCARSPTVMITGIIFDLDGLLADTEKLHCRAYQTAMLEQGFDLSEMDYAEHWVRRGDGIVDWVTAHNLAVDPAAVRARKSAHYLELLATCLQPMEGALELLTSLRGKMKIALASSSYRDAVDGVLAGLNIADFFEVIVSGLV